MGKFSIHLLKINKKIKINYKNRLEGVEVNYNRKLRLFHITSYQFSTNPNTGSTNNDLKEIQPEKKNNQLVEVKPPSFGTRVNNLLKRAGTKMMDELRYVLKDSSSSIHSFSYRF